MARARSRIKSELPADVLAELNAQIVDGRKTIDQLTAWLAGQGHDIPRTNVGRHVQQVEQMAATLSETREIVKAVSSRLDAADDAGAMTDQLVEMLHAVVYRGFTTLLADADRTIDPEDMHFLARTLKDAAAAKKSNVDRMINAAKLAAAKAAAREALDKAADAVERTAQAAGLTKQTVAQIRRSVLGVSE